MVYAMAILKFMVRDLMHYLEEGDFGSAESVRAAILSHARDNEMLG